MRPGINRLFLVSGGCALAYLALVGFLLFSIFKPVPLPEEIVVTSLQSRNRKTADGSLITLCGQGFSQDLKAFLNLDIGNHFAIVGKMPSWGIAKAVAARGHLGFLGDTIRGLQVVDLADVTRPKMVGALKLSGWP